LFAATTMFDDECFACHAWIEPTDDNLCVDCHEKYTHEWRFHGDIPDWGKQMLNSRYMTFEDDPVFTPADRAHGVMWSESPTGHAHFRPDKLTAMMTERGALEELVKHLPLDAGTNTRKDPYVHRLYREAGASLQVFIDTFAPSKAEVE